MPQIYIQLFVWHVVSRLLVLFLFLTSTDMNSPPWEGEMFGWVFNLIAWNGIGFFVLLLAVCLPTLLGRSVPMALRINAFNGICLGLFGAIHDSFFGFGMAWGFEIMMHHVGTPLRDAFPVPRVLVFFFAVGYSIGVPILLALSHRRPLSDEIRRGHLIRFSVLPWPQLVEPASIGRAPHWKRPVR